MAKLFFSYSHKDEALRDELEIHLAMLKRQGLIESWHDREILAGDELDGEIDAQLEAADVIMLLVSLDFLASNYCYDREVRRAMDRHNEGSARVIAVVLRPCEWKETPFSKLLVTPADGRPVTKWPTLDDGFLDVITQIRAALPSDPRPSIPSLEAALVEPKHPRSSNLRITREFSDADRDRFMEGAFDYMARHFEGSLEELAKRHAEIETAFRRIDAQAFRATIYRDGKKVSECVIEHGSGVGFGNGITYGHQRSHGSGGGFSEHLSLDEREQSLGLKPLGMNMHMMGEKARHLTHEGAAELYWERLIEPLQRK